MVGNLISYCNYCLTFVFLFFLVTRLRLLRKMAKKRIRKVKNRSKSTNRNSGFFAVSEVNVNPVNRTFLPDDTVARISTDDWWEDISIPGYTSKRNLLRKLQEDDIYDDTRIVTSPFMNWWSHVGSRNLPDHLPREHKISVSPTLPDVPATPEIQHVGRRIPQERFDNMWDEKTEDISSNPRTIKNARGSVLQKPKPNLELCATENILEKEQHHSDSGNLSEHSLLYTSTDFTNRIIKQKGSKSIRRRKENYQKLALLNNIKKIELPDQNGSYESNKGHGSESESVKTRKIQLSKLMSCENNSISYPNVTDTYNSLPERAQKTGRFYDAFKDDTVSITNEDLHLSQNSNKMLSDLSGVTDIKGRLSLSSSNTKDMKRARKQRKLLHVSWSGQIDPNNSNVQHRRNITSLLDMTNPSIKNEFESKKTPKNGLKYLQAFLDVSNEDKLSEVNYKQTGKEDESTFLSKLNLKPKSTQREQFLNIEDLNEIPSEKLLTQLSHSEHKVLTKMSSLSDGSDSELPLPRSTSFRFSSSPQSTRDTSVGNVPTVSKVKSKFLQNLQHDTSICDSLSAESTTGTGKKLILSRASRNAKRGLISDKLLAFSDVSENSKEKENETLLEEVETTLKNSRRDLSATGNVHADMKTKFTKSLAMTDLLTKQSAALHLQEENKSFLDTSQSYGSKNLNKLQHSKNYDTETELPNLQLGTSVLREVTENSKGSSILENRREAKHGVLESNNSRRDLSASEKERVQKTNGSRLHNITDSRSKLQQSLQDLSRHDISKEISSNLQHDPEITHEDVSKSEPKVNNRSRVFSETDKEKQVHFESNEHSDQEASKSLMGDKQVPKRRSQRLSSQHSKNDNDASKLFTDQLAHQSDEENANDSGVSATRKKVEHGVQVPKNSRRDLSASEKESAQERSKDLRLHFVTDSPSKQSTKQQLHHRNLSKHSMAKEVSSKVQHERERTLEDVSRSESEVNNQSRVFSDTDKEKQVHFESNVHSDQEASKSLMGDKQVPKRRNQRLSSQHSKNDNDASKLFTDQLSHQSDEENANDSGVSAARKQAEHGVQVPKNSRRDLSASEIVSAQEKSKDLRLHFVTDSPSKQSTKQQPSHQGLSQDSTSKEISSNMQHEREITHEDVSNSESEVSNQCSEFLEKNEQKHVHFEVNTLSRQEESMSFLEADQASKCRSLRISSQQSKNVDNDVSKLVSDISLLQGVGENSNESRINVSEKRGGQRVMIQKNSGKGLSASENMNVEEARKHSVSNVISSTDRSTLQRTLQDLMKSFTTERVSANANNEREITHEGSVSKLTNRRRVCLESCEKEQSSVRSNIYSGNKDESTSLVKIAQTSKDEVRLKSLDSMNVFISPVIAQGVKRRIMKQGIADHSKSVPASSITQPGMKLVPSEKHDSRGKMNSHLTINTSQSSRDVVKSPENISNNKSQPQRLRSNMEYVFRTHTSTSNKDKYQKETNNESVKDTKSPSARIRTKSSTSQSSFPQSKVIALDSKSDSMKNNSKAIDTVISKSKFMGNKFNTLFLEESRPKEDERDILSTTIVENNLGIMSQKLSAVRSHLKRQHEKLTLLQYRKACKQIQTHPANYAKFKKLLAHREKMEDIFNVNDRHSSKNNHVLNIRSQKKDIAEKKSNRETERVASILQYVKSTKSPLRISWGNAVGHPKLTAAVSKTKTSVNRKLKTSDRNVIIIRDVNKAPRIKRPTWLHARLYKSLSKTIVTKIKDKNVINPQKESQEIISKLGSLIDKALRYRRKGCNPFVDEVIKHLYHSAIIKTPMNFICFCMRYLPETFVDIALRVKENDSGILGNVIDRDLNL